MKWFKHDSNAHSDAKLKRLKYKYGIVGYGIYWYCIELIAGDFDKENISLKLEEDSELIALEWGLEEAKVDEILRYMISLKLFEEHEGRVTCLKLAKRMDDTNAKNPEIKAIVKRLNDENNAESVGVTRSNSEFVGESRSNSEFVGESPKVSDQIRLDQIRIDKEKNTLVENSDSSGSKDTDRIVLFEKVWEFYGKRGNRKSSLSRFLKLKSKDLEKLLIHVKKYVKSNPQVNFRKAFERYMSNRCFEDEIINAGNVAKFNRPEVVRPAATKKPEITEKESQDSVDRLNSYKQAVK